MIIISSPSSVMNPALEGSPGIGMSTGSVLPTADRSMSGVVTPYLVRNS